MDYNSSIHKACFDGDLEAVKKYLADGCDINATNSLRSTPLACAVAHGHEDVVALLIKEGADISILDYWGNSAFRWAMQFKLENIIKMLIDAGADINDVDVWKKEDEALVEKLNSTVRDNR